MVIPLLSGEEVRPCLMAIDMDMVIDMVIDIHRMDTDIGTAIHITVETI